MIIWRIHFRTSTKLGMHSFQNLYKTKQNPCESNIILSFGERKLIQLLAEWLRTHFDIVWDLNVKVTLKIWTWFNKNWILVLTIITISCEENTFGLLIQYRCFNQVGEIFWGIWSGWGPQEVQRWKGPETEWIYHSFWLGKSKGKLDSWSGVRVYLLFSVVVFSDSWEF